MADLQGNLCLVAAGAISENVPVVSPGSGRSTLARDALSGQQRRRADHACWTAQRGSKQVRAAECVTLDRRFRLFPDGSRIADADGAAFVAVGHVTAVGGIAGGRSRSQPIVVPFSAAKQCNARPIAKT